MCKCIEELNEKLAPKNAEVLITLFPVVRPIISTQKIETKKRGSIPMVVATFCPFCGEKYPDDDKMITKGYVG